MQGANRKLGEGGVDQEGEFDLRGGDGANIDPPVGERTKRPRRHARVAAHADADNGDFRHVARGVEPPQPLPGPPTERAPTKGAGGARLDD